MWERATGRFESPAATVWLPSMLLVSLLLLVYALLPMFLQFLTFLLSLEILLLL
jgi:hypothetical protein